MLPRAATDLIALIGEMAALRLMQALCGQTVEFPKGELGRGAAAYNELSEIIGEEATQMLCKHYGGDRLYIPFCNKHQLSKRNCAIVARYNVGASVDSLVREYRLSDRQIRNILKLTDTSAAQRDLFAI